jgi:hypothetical protein
MFSSISGVNRWLARLARHDDRITAIPFEQRAFSGLSRYRRRRRVTLDIEFDRLRPFDQYRCVKTDAGHGFWLGQVLHGSTDSSFENRER